MDSKPKDEKWKVYHGETPEELLESMAGKVDEKYQKEIMKIINEERAKSANEASSGDDQAIEEFHFHRSEVSSSNKREIVVLRTATSTLITPILMNKSTNVDISIEIAPEQKSISVNDLYPKGEVLSKTIDNPDVSLSVESDIKSQDGVVPLLIIPHECEGNDNDASIAKIIEYLQLSFPDKITVEEMPVHDDTSLTGMMIEIK